MKYPYIVNKNGIWYPAGADVPEDAKPIKDDVSVDFEDKIYTKTEINRTSTADLQKIAIEQGIDGAEQMTGSELKKVLIDKFGL